MKPTSHNAAGNKRAGVNDLFSREFPVTDYSFQSLTLDDYRGGRVITHTRSFRNISNNYFRNEARVSFMAEAALFGVIIATTIGPVLQSAHAITDLVRAFAGV